MSGTGWGESLGMWPAECPSRGAVPGWDRFEQRALQNSPRREAVERGVLFGEVRRLAATRVSVFNSSSPQELSRGCFQTGFFVLQVQKALVCSPEEDEEAAWTCGSACGLPSARCVLCSDALIKREVFVKLRGTSL